MVSRLGSATTEDVKWALADDGKFAYERLPALMGPSLLRYRTAPLMGAPSPWSAWSALLSYTTVARMLEKEIRIVRPLSKGGKGEMWGYGWYLRQLKELKSEKNSYMVFEGQYSRAWVEIS